MTIVKINLHKEVANRNLEAKGGQINIKKNVSLKNEEELSFAVEGKKGLKFTFAFNCDYQPDLGKIEVEGQVLYVNDEAKIKEIKSGWEKNKSIPQEVMEQII